jgi:hypothetical protein
MSVPQTGAKRGMSVRVLARRAVMNWAGCSLASHHAGSRVTTGADDVPASRSERHCGTRPCRGRETPCSAGGRNKSKERHVGASFSTSSSNEREQGREVMGFSSLYFSLRRLKRSPLGLPRFQNRWRTA